MNTQQITYEQKLQSVEKNKTLLMLVLNKKKLPLPKTEAPA